jgi:hypothetical protein
MVAGMSRRPSESRSLRVLLANPALPAYIRTLSPVALAQICSRVGLSDASELMALAPPGQLVRALDASVWKTVRPGLREVFDARELVEWLAAWLEIGDEFTAERLGAIPDTDLMVYFSHVLRVSTVDMWGFERSTEIGDLDRIYAPSYHESVYGHYVATAAEPSHWETVQAALDALWLHAPERLLHLFSQLVGDESMLAPQSNRESSNDDFASQRESFRERRGHVTAAGAQAFLALANAPMSELLTLSQYDLETRRHLAQLDSSEEEGQECTGGQYEPNEGATESQLAVVRSQMEAAGLIEPVRAGALLGRVSTGKESHTSGSTGGERGVTGGGSRRRQAHAPSAEPRSTSDRVFPPQRALEHGAGERTSPDAVPAGILLVERLAQLAADDRPAFDVRSRELAYLASVLIAGVTLNGRSLTREEARGAALATCNLGLELLEQQGADARIDTEPGLVRPFLVGWQTLGRLPGRVVETLTRSLSRLQACALRTAQRWMLDDATSNLAEMRAAVSRRDFSAAREAALLLSFVFDPRACRAIVPLLDELPHLEGERDAAPQWLRTMADLRRTGALLRRIGKPPRR